MNVEVKKKWVKALRSGRYRQTEHCLSGRNGREQNCCLGVLARVCRRKEDWREERLLSEVTASSGKKLHLELGLTREQERRLASRNDHGDSFSEIADYIEANL